jgi:hypothetical protein
LLDRRTHAHRWRVVAALAVLILVVPFVAGGSAGAQSPVAVVTNFPVHAEFRPDDPGFLDQWGLRQVVEDPNPPPPPTPPPNAWDVTYGSPSVVVAVVDTGVWWTHADILANMWDNPTGGTHGFDFVDQDTNPMDVDPNPQPIFHGTGVAGVIAAILDNGQGVAGTAQVRVMALRALGANGQGSSLNTSQAIRWAVDHGAKVINLSLGTNETFGGPTDIQLAVDYAWRRGALIVAAAGNAGTGTLDYPARLSNVVSVAAIDETGNRATFSNYGSGLDIAAPGDRILTLDANNNIHYLRGTSFAAPFVTGVASLLLSMDGNLTNVELWNILNTTAVQPGGGSGPNTNYGWGVVNAWNALNALSQPFISVNAYPTSVSRTSTFGVTWSILGPPGGVVTDTHVVWGTSPAGLQNATAAQTGATRQSYTASGLSIPSGSDTLYFKVVATVNGTLYESPQKTITASNLPDFLFVLYQLLASNLLYLALFILALAAIVAFIPQRRAARARRYAYPPRTMYPASYYVGSPGPPQPPPAPLQPRTVSPAPPIEFVRQPIPPGTPTGAAPPAATVTRPVAAKKRCPSCGTMVAAENLFCFFCGTPFR